MIFHPRASRRFRAHSLERVQWCSQYAHDTTISSRWSIPSQSVHSGRPVLILEHRSKSIECRISVLDELRWGNGCYLNGCEFGFHLRGVESSLTFRWDIDSRGTYASIGHTSNHKSEGPRHSSKHDVPGVIVLIHPSEIPPPGVSPINLTGIPLMNLPFLLQTIVQLPHSGGYHPRQPVFFITQSCIQVLGQSSLDHLLISEQRICKQFIADVHVWDSSRRRFLITGCRA